LLNAEWPRRRESIRALCFLALFPALALAGCAHRPVARRPAPPPLPPPPPAEMQPAVPGQYVEQGVASWYGVPFNGHRTSNGEIYDMYQFTAAHRTLPFDSVVRVTNLRNSKQTEVRINDRGPFVENRVIDLSLAAARALDMVGTGTAQVRIELVSGPNPLVGFFTVQVGAFQLKENAERLRVQLSASYSPVTIQEYDSPTGIFYRVRVGRVPSQEAAHQLAEQLRNEQFLPMIVRLDE
jgi:rare lipoprotein A